MSESTILDADLHGAGMAACYEQFTNGKRDFVSVSLGVANALGKRPSEIRTYLRAWYGSTRDYLEDSGADVFGASSDDEVREAYTWLARWTLWEDMATPSYDTPSEHDLRTLMASALTAPTPDAIMHFAGFANRMRGFGPFNVQMIYAQRPGAGLVASRREWEAQGRTVRPGAIPIIVLRPMGPIDYVIEELDTDPPTQRDPTRDVFAACGELNPERLDRLIEALAKPTKRHLLVHIQRRPTGASLAGWIVGGPLVPVDEVPSGFKEPMGPIWNVSINERLTPAEQFVTLLHELGHLFCGHLGPFSDSNLNADEFGWPDRRHLPRATMEIEAELVAWWLANREGLTTGSPLYLRPYLEQAGSAVAKVDLDRVTRAVARVRGYLGGKP